MQCVAKTLSYLGSEELYERIIKDLNDLMHSAFDYGYIPAQLVVGRLFVEMSCCHSIIVDLSIGNWAELCVSNRKCLTELLAERLLEVIKSLEEKEGYLGAKETVDIFYDPDEPYLSLYAIYPHQDPEDSGEVTTGDGYPIRRFRFKDEEIDPEGNLH